MPGFGEIFEEWERLRSEEERAARRKAESGAAAGEAKPATNLAAAGNPATGKATTGKTAKGAASSASERVTEPVRSRGGARAALQSWLDTHGIEDSGREATAQAERSTSAREAEAMRVDARIDLHGLSVAEAEAALEAFFREAAASGARKVLIVHGKGLHSKEGPVLKEATRRFLERSRLAGRSGTAPRDQGGGGATWALLRRP